MRTNTRIRQNRSKERGATLLLVTISTLSLVCCCGHCHRSRGSLRGARRSPANRRRRRSRGRNDSGYLGIYVRRDRHATAKRQRECRRPRSPIETLVSGRGSRSSRWRSTIWQPASGLPTPNNPQVTVTVDHPAGTYFERVFGGGHRFYDVAASATAEVYNPSGVPGAPAIIAPGASSRFSFPIRGDSRGAPTSSSSDGYPGHDPNLSNSSWTYPGGNHWSGIDIFERRTGGRSVVSRSQSMD